MQRAKAGGVFPSKTMPVSAPANIMLVAATVQVSLLIDYSYLNVQTPYLVLH